MDVDVVYLCGAGLLFVGITMILFYNFANFGLSNETADDDSIPLLTRNEMVTPADVVIPPIRLKRISDIAWSNELSFTLNGKVVKLINPDPADLLVTFIRDKAGLKGTKLGCEEGGCGACTVVLNDVHSANSCLRFLCAVDGMSITTVEGLGSLRKGLCNEQKGIVDKNGTQCGFCTPGWVANMHALNQAVLNGDRPAPSHQEIENYFDGNICRCTGYKPILDAAFSIIPHKQTKECNGVCGGENCSKSGSCAIEDIGKNHSTVYTHSHSSMVTSSSRKKSTSLRPAHNSAINCSESLVPLCFHRSDTNIWWYRPICLEDLCSVLREYQNRSSEIQIMGGNTSIGVTKYLNDSAPYNSPDKYSVMVDINAIAEMTVKAYDASSRVLTVGSAVPLTELISFLREYANLSNESTVSSQDVAVVNHHSVFSVTAHHLSLVANTQVRNVASWAGNLGVFLLHQEFPSDVVLALTNAKAELSICDVYGTVSTMSMDVFLQQPGSSLVSRGAFILSLTMMESTPFNPAPRAVNTVAESFKICAREHNAHAQVNAGFNLQISHDSLSRNSGPLCHSARIVIGGVSSKTFIATRTEQVLIQSRICDRTLRRALIALTDDLEAVGVSNAFGNSSYRISVMQTCLYRAMLRTINKCDVPTNLLSALEPFIKPTSRGVNIFEDHSQDAPLHVPTTKLEAQAQATGEATFPSDEVISAQSLYGALVFSSQCAVLLAAIDPSQALAIDGVVCFLSAKDIPGKNTVDIHSLKLFVEVGAEIECVGAPVGVILATSDTLANQAAALVKLTYTDIGKTPITNIAQAIAEKSFYKFPSIVPFVTLLRAGEPEKAMLHAAHRARGTVNASGQNHFYMETQTAVATLVDGQYIEVTCGTQDPTTYQNYVAGVLAMDVGKVTVKCSRTGGGFGGKLTRGLSTAAAAALAASITGRSVRIFNTRTADMHMNSGREGYSFEYEVGYDDTGKIISVIYDVYVDAGCNSSDGIGGLTMAMTWADNAYYLPNYMARAKVCYTNTPARTFARAPGVLQSNLVTGVVIDRVAFELGLDPAAVKSANFICPGLPTIVGQVVEDSQLDRVWNTLLQRSHYTKRFELAKDFNSKNLWRKRGISIDPVKYGIGWSMCNAGVQIGIFKEDGTVSVCHTGVEIGQGINTKIAQTVASQLGIDMSYIRVVQTSTQRIANGGSTGGSSTSEVCCQAAVDACNIINARLVSTKQAHPDLAWPDLLSRVSSEVSLNAEGWFSPKGNPNGNMFQYFVWGACVSEVELDVLSGMVHVLSSEIVYDCGKSLNPAVDVGQIAGGFVMAMGYFLQESVSYAADGSLQSIGTWEYKPPLAQDIPSVFNLTLLRRTPNTSGILRSKAVGEPCIVLANSVFFAVKMAIAAARVDAGLTRFVDIEAPMSIDVRQQACAVEPRRFDMPF